MKTLTNSSGRKVKLFRFISLIIIVLLLFGLEGCAFLAPSGPVLTYDLAEPLDGAKAAKFDLYTGSGNLTIDSLTGGEPLLAGGTLQYIESLGIVNRTLESFNGQSSLALKWGENSGPCNGSIEWLIHLNPTVTSDITANSGGGNVKLNLAAMSLTRLSTETGGGNMDVVLPDSITTLIVTAKSGAGNVTVSVPSGIAARIHATTSLGKIIMAPQFSQVDKETYQSSDYDSAANKVELTLSSGAGNVEVKSK